MNIMEKMVGVYKKSFRISSEECDEQGRLTIAKLARLLEYLADMHLEQFELNADSLRKDGFLWVVVKRNVKVHRMACSGEMVTLETWTGKEKNWLYPKWFCMMDENGSKLLEASCLWALVDNKSRKLAMPPERMKLLPTVSPEGALPLPPWNVNFPNLCQETVRTVTGSLLDRNQHMNNSCYFDWAESLLDEGYLSTHEIKELWIEYARELRENQNVSLHYSKNERELYVKGLCKNEIVFSAKLEYGRV